MPKNDDKKMKSKAMNAFNSIEDMVLNFHKSLKKDNFDNSGELQDKSKVKALKDLKKKVEDKYDHEYAKPLSKLHGFSRDDIRPLAEALPTNDSKEICKALRVNQKKRLRTEPEFAAKYLIQLDPDAMDTESTDEESDDEGNDKRLIKALDPKLQKKLQEAKSIEAMRDRLCDQVHELWPGEKRQHSKQLEARQLAYGAHWAHHCLLARLAQMQPDFKDEQEHLIKPTPLKRKKPDEGSWVAERVKLLEERMTVMADNTTGKDQDRSKQTEALQNEYYEFLDENLIEVDERPTSWENYMFKEEFEEHSKPADALMDPATLEISISQRSRGIKPPKATPDRASRKKRRKFGKIVATRGPYFAVRQSSRKLGVYTLLNAAEIAQKRIETDTSVYDGKDLSLRKLGGYKRLPSEGQKQVQQAFKGIVGVADRGLKTLDKVKNERKGKSRIGDTMIYCKWRETDEAPNTYTWEIRTDLRAFYGQKLADIKILTFAKRAAKRFDKTHDSDKLDNPEEPKDEGEQTQSSDDESDDSSDDESNDSSDDESSDSSDDESNDSSDDDDGNGSKKLQRRRRRQRQ